MANPDLKENVLLNLRSVTQSVKGGVPIGRLDRDYRDLLGSPIPFRELGYNNLEAFIRDIPHVISLRKNNEGQLIAQGVADSSTAHIVSLVSRQKTDTKKKTFRKPPPFGGMRKSLSSRYTFREGYRGSHSSYSSSSNQTAKRTPVKISPKSQPSRAPPSVSHSKPTVSDQVPVRSKYEVAPRFLKLKENKNVSPPSKEPVSPPSKEPSIELISPPSSSASSHYSVSLNDSEEIPPPRAVNRSLPIIKPPTNSRAQQLDALESARNAREFVNIYAKMNDLGKPIYRTVLFGQKAKSKGFVSTLKLGDKSYQSYPEMKQTEELAEEEAASKAMAAIKEKKEYLNALPETPYSNADEIRTLLSRIEEIVCEKPSGMFANGIVREYEQKFNEKLPSCWPELLKQSFCVEVEELRVEYGQVPEGANIIVRPVREVSSGNQTPSSTSSKTEHPFEDLDNLKKSLVDISLPKVPEIGIPTGNFWSVYITYVSGWFSARLVDYDDDFLELSNEMSQFYKARSFAVVDVFEGQVYAACIDNNSNIWHRVIVEEVKEDGQISCYFVDDGDFSYLKKENLQEISPSFLKLPYQAVHIALEGLDEYEKCIRNDVLENHLLGKTLIAEVKRWDPIPDFFPDISGIHRTIYCVVLYDTSDEDINLNELLKKSAIESLNCRLPKLATSSCAYLSHVTPDGLIYLRLTNPQNCWIEHELDRLSSTFEEAAAMTAKIPFQTLCAAKYESGTWHRAIVSESLHASVDPEVVEVFFVDFGHAGVVGKSEICELKPISELLASVPYQAFCCELINALPSPNSRWTELAIAKLLELAPFDQELIVRVMKEEDGKNLAKVHLYKRNENSDIISINDSLSCNPTLFYQEPSTAQVKVPSVLPLQTPKLRKNSLKNNLSGFIPDVAVPAEQMAKKLATSLSSDKIEWLNTPDTIKSPEAFEVNSPVTLSLPPVPEKGELFDVFVTMAAHPHNFVVQPLNSCPALNELMMEMKSFYTMEENLLEMDFDMLRKNDYYAALHSDGSWYRVRIEEIMSGSQVLVAVHYVDFGDFNTVSIQRLQPLYQKFKLLPLQAIKASLAGIKPYDSDWDPMHCIKFREMVTEKSFVSVICRKQVQVQDDVPSLHLELSTLIDTTDSSKDVYIHELLVDKKIAKRK